MSVRKNKYGQPIGEEVNNWEQRRYPVNLHAEGKYAIVTRLTHDHARPLYHAYQASHPSNWTYLADDPPESFEAFEQSLNKKIENEINIYYAVLRKETNEPLGILSLMRVDQINGVVEVGDINFSDALRRTRISTEVHYMLACYVFEELGYRRYEWKCDSLNAPSIKTANRLGFTYEGTFKQNVIYKNRSRDTSWFAMIQEDWPKEKQAYLQWLAEDNFDSQGVQLNKIEAFRK